jgi:hypothetical protein
MKKEREISSDVQGFCNTNKKISRKRTKGKNSLETKYIH